MRRNADSLIKQLEGHGLVFRSFQVEHVGSYAPSDADWNYKDVPHLNEIHELVDAVISDVRDDSIASMNLQRVPGFRFPISVYNYVAADGTQVYYTTLFVYVLVVVTAFDQVSATETRVTTTYHVGGSRPAMAAFPLIKWVLRRNYENLMLGDIPMRTRRGVLRSWGYTFAGDEESHGFERTMRLTDTNVVPPPRQRRASYRLSLRNVAVGEEALLGRPDHLGLRVQRQEQELVVYPRMCMHEGACLDDSACEADGKLKCPWHARMVAPVARIDLSRNGPLFAETAYHSIVVSEDVMLVSVRADD